MSMPWQYTWPVIPAVQLEHQGAGSGYGDRRVLRAAGLSAAVRAVADRHRPDLDEALHQLELERAPSRRSSR